MAKTSFECEIEVAAPRERVFGFLRYLPNHVLVHPMVLCVEPRDELELREPVATLPEGQRSTPRRFRVVDFTRLGPLRVRFPYEVTLVVRPPDEMYFEASRFPAVLLRNTMACTPAPGGTRVHERSDIEAPAPLIGFIRRVALTAHEQMFAAVKRHLERG